MVDDQLLISCHNPGSRKDIKRKTVFEQNQWTPKQCRIIGCCKSVLPVLLGGSESETG